MTVITFKMPYNTMTNLNSFTNNLSMNNNGMLMSVFSQSNMFSGMNVMLQPQVSNLNKTFVNVSQMQMPNMKMTTTQAQANKVSYPNTQFGMLTLKGTNTVANRNITSVSTTSVNQSVKVEELIKNSNNSQFINPANAKISENGLNLLKQFDKVHLTSYKDTGKYYSIGYGHNGPEVKPGDTCTLEEAEATLREDMDKFTKNVAKQVKVPLTQNQLDALSVFAHNVGNGAFNKSTLLKKLNSGDYVGAANELDRWVHADGKVLNGLVKRRNAEKQLFLKDVQVA